MLLAPIRSFSVLISHQSDRCIRVCISHQSDCSSLFASQPSNDHLIWKNLKNKTKLIGSHFNEWKCKRQSHRGNFSSEIKFSHDTCHAAEQGNSDSQIFFVRRSQKAKWGVCCPGPEGRNTAHFLTFDGSNKERENLACPCCNFELDAMQTSVWMMKFRALFFTFVTLPSILGVFLFNCWQLWRRAPLFFFEIWKNWSAPPKHTGVSDVFFPIWKFLKHFQWGVTLENRCVDRF